MSLFITALVAARTDGSGPAYSPGAATLAPEQDDDCGLVPGWF